MKRGESSGGGQSSLGYLFGSSDNKPKNEVPPASPVTPPYGTDIDDDNKLTEIASPDKTRVSNNKGQGQNSPTLFIIGRPSTKVKSPPGGDSSLGYLFGDK